VHFHEVLIPIARRAMAVRAGAEHWAIHEAALSALPTVRVRNTVATVAQYYAASYIAAAYRRRQSIILLASMKRRRLAAGRLECSRLGLDPRTHGFHSIRFGDEALAMDPLAFTPERFREFVARRMAELQQLREERKRQQQKAKNPLESVEHAAGTAEAAAADNAAATAIAASSSSPKPRRTTLERGYSAPAAQTASLLANTIRVAGDLGQAEQAAIHSKSEYHLPAVYHSAISEKRHFGPDVPEAIVRHERRAQKLLKLEREGSEGEMYAPLGSNPEIWRAGAAEQRHTRF
jgi:hypothetical protein